MTDTFLPVLSRTQTSAPAKPPLAPYLLKSKRRKQSAWRCDILMPFWLSSDHVFPGGLQCLSPAWGMSHLGDGSQGQALGVLGDQPPHEPSFPVFNRVLQSDRQNHSQETCTNLDAPSVWKEFETRMSTSSKGLNERCRLHHMFPLLSKIGDGKALWNNLFFISMNNLGN